MPTDLAAARVSVIVPHYNQLEALKLCLASLVRQSLARERFEILVVDNNSPCGLEAVRGVVADRARLLSEVEKGAGPARNRGAAAASGDVFAFIDADCVASPQWLEEGLHGLASYDIVGGRVDVSVNDENAMTGAEAFERVFAFDFRSYIESKGFTGSGNLFCRRAVFERVGGFRPAVSEDRDWCFRATALGYSLGYHEGAAIAHPARVDWHELTHKWGRINRETLALSRAKRWGALRFLAHSWLLPASVVPHAIKAMRSAKLPDTATRLSSVRTLARLRIWRMIDAHRAVFRG